MEFLVIVVVVDSPKKIDIDSDCDHDCEVVEGSLS